MRQQNFSEILRYNYPMREFEIRYIMYQLAFEETGDMRAYDNAVFWFIAATMGKEYAQKHFMP